MIGLIAQGGIFAPHFKLGMELNRESAWGGSLLVAYLGFGAGAYLLLYQLWQRQQQTTCGRDVVEKNI